MIAPCSTIPTKSRVRGRNGPATTVFARACTTPEHESCSTCFFRNAVTDAAHRLIVRTRVVKTFAKGDYLMHAGEEPHGIWAICRGRIKVFQETEEGKYLTIRIAGPGDLVGHRSFLAKKVFWGSGVALEETVTAYLPAPAIHKLIAEDPRVRDEIIRRLALDMGHAESLATTMAYRSAEERLLVALREMSRQVDGGNEHDPIEIVAPRQELAELAGMTVEATVRTLRRLEIDGVAQSRGRKIIINDPLRLSEAVAEF